VSNKEAAATGSKIGDDRLLAEVMREHLVLGLPKRPAQPVWSDPFRFSHRSPADRQARETQHDRVITAPSALAA
jgi:hypothetical protein